MLRKKKAILVSIVVITVALLFYFGNGFLFTEDKVMKGNERENIQDMKSGSDNIDFTIDQFTSAVLENDTDLVNQIIESYSVNINEKDSEGQYPIEMVLPMDNCNMAKILLEAGADPYVITSSGKSVYDMVIEGGSKHLKEIFSQYTK